MRDRLDAIASIAYYAVRRTSPLASALSAAVLCAALPFVARTSVPRRATPVAEAFDVGMMHVERFGTKGRQAVVFIPALFCGSWQWNREIDSLASRYDVYAVTLPGFDGRSFAAAGDTTPPDLMQRAADDLSRLIRERRSRTRLSSVTASAGRSPCCLARRTQINRARSSRSKGATRLLPQPPNAPRAWRRARLRTTARRPRRSRPCSARGCYAT